MSVTWIDHAAPAPNKRDWGSFVNRWEVLTSAEIEVSVNHPLARFYQFNMNVPPDTGVDIATGRDAACSYPSASSDNTGWVSAGSDRKVVFHLVRCRVGSGNSQIAITSRPGIFGNPELSVVANMRRAPHQRDSVVYYRLCGDPPSQPLDVDYPKSISLGAAEWNTGSQIGVSFQKLTNETCSSPGEDPHSSNANKRIVSVAHWNPNGNGCTNPDAYGCVIPSFIVGDEEHYTEQTLYYRHPLPPGSEWVDKTYRVVDDFYYLPAVISHEFGHTAGLGHSPRREDILYRLAEDFDDPSGPLIPQQNDRDAMRALYPAQTHSH